MKNQTNLDINGLEYSLLIKEEAAQLIRGKEITPKFIEEVSEIAWKTAHPVANTTSSPKCRREMVWVFTRNAIQEALNNINHTDP